MMKICDLDHLEMSPQKTALNDPQNDVMGGVKIDTLQISLALGSSLAFTKSFGFVWSWAPRIFDFSPTTTDSI